MKRGDKMSKKAKRIIAALVIIAIIAIAVIAYAVKTGNDKDTKEPQTMEQQTTEAALPSFEDPANETDKNGLKDSDKETNYWDNVEVVEDGNDNKETVTDKNGDVIVEEYPGKDEGWSPIISPEDLNDDK